MPKQLFIICLTIGLQSVKLCIKTPTYTVFKQFLFLWIHLCTFFRTNYPSSPKLCFISLFLKDIIKLIKPNFTKNSRTNFSFYLLSDLFQLTKPAPCALTKSLRPIWKKLKTYPMRILTKRTLHMTTRKTNNYTTYNFFCVEMQKKWFP